MLEKCFYVKYFDVFFIANRVTKNGHLQFLARKKVDTKKPLNLTPKLLRTHEKNAKRHKNRSVTNLKSQNSTKWQQCFHLSIIKTHSQIIRSLKSNYFYMQIFGVWHTVCVFFSRSWNTRSTIIWFGIF